MSKKKKGKKIDLEADEVGPGGVLSVAGGSVIKGNRPKDEPTPTSSEDVDIKVKLKDIKGDYINAYLSLTAQKGTTVIAPVPTPTPTPTPASNGGGGR